MVGAYVSALLLDNHCETVFYLSGTSIIGELFSSVNLSPMKIFSIFDCLFSTVIGILTFFIPNIHKKVEKSEVVVSSVPRHSVISLK